MGEFLLLLSAIRTYRQEKKRETTAAHFDKYDRDRNGKLSIEELSSLLCDVGCVPHSRKEQEELAQLIHLVDLDGNGFIDFSEFQVLSQRIEEKLKSMRYEEEIEHAMSIGFTETQLNELRWIFDSLDSD